MRVRNLMVTMTTVFALAFPMAADAYAADTTPPVPPTIWLEDLNWQASPSFGITWSEPPDQETPISAVYYEICTSPVTCQTRMVPNWEGKGSGGIQRLAVTAFSHPTGAEHQVRIWLADAAGNVNPIAKSNSVTLRYDPWSPELAVFEIPHGDWLNADEAHLHSITIEYASDPLLASGIAGYSITRDGTLPDDIADVSTLQNSSLGRATVLLKDLPEGLTVLKARAVSGAGLWSNEPFITQGVLKVDKSPPSAFASSSVNLADWQRNPVEVRLKGTDQPTLSGMDPAPTGNPILTGGHITYRLDGGPLQLVSGNGTDVPMDVDGHHILSYQVHDVAGNASPERTIEVKVDGTAPAAAFEPLQAADPRRLRVSVRDATSGVSGGAIEMRAEDASTFRSLNTQVVAGKLVAELDDDVPDGRYLIRARVWDRAGNETTSDDRTDGGQMTVTLPVRTPTRLRAKTSAHPVDHRTRALIRGHLTTNTGQALPNSRITILDRPRTGDSWQPAGWIRTDNKGRFRHRAQARRPSRSIRYVYAGASTVKPVSQDLSVRVRAGVTLAVNRTWLLNGDAVVFSGHISAPVPKSGKVVALQARKGSKWVTFGTPRANRKGTFKLRYRFVSTTGLQKYRFRAIAMRESLYPYETGASRSLKVTVRGL